MRGLPPRFARTGHSAGASHAPASSRLRLGHVGDRSAVHARLVAAKERRDEPAPPDPRPVQSLSSSPEGSSPSDKTAAWSMEVVLQNVGRRNPKSSRITFAFVHVRSEGGVIVKTPKALSRSDVAFTRVRASRKTRKAKTPRCRCSPPLALPCSRSTCSDRHHAQRANQDRRDLYLCLERPATNTERGAVDASRTT
jgi:hypothetical protein